ncbi:MFS transporter [Prosthecomicrobium pneumaticum]|uniref:Putative MFS family arabinose efflux permease n=1 Tax=Prosthecomicrobium pneumaticum TaxID=81895 RepID=A0A7W9L2J2_9HYPH|nr:MFS transporter [Prosthecomicrobium pneumaticum]MBB5753562.1 putative MFS family arabinose efflux permease [Prosthecomicrobium pneumaticum]
MLRSLIWLSLGAFALGTEAFMIAGILPAMAADLGVSIPLAGHLVTIFALTYAFGAPLMAVATAALPRKPLLVGALAAFALANLLAALSPNYALLALSRVLMALAAATFMPAASGYAALAVPPEKRGRALSIVYAGMTVAIVIGVPLGTMLAERHGWRATFVVVAGLAALALAGIAAALPKVANPPHVGLAERFAVARRPDVLRVLALTVLALAGAFSVNTYMGAYLIAGFGASGETVAAFLFLMGLGGAVGNLLGGYAADRWDRQRFLGLVLVVLIVAFLGLAVIVEVAPGTAGLAAAAALTLVWGLFGWAFPSVQQVRLVSLAPERAAITLSLNSSAIYLGTALGAAAGAFAIDIASVEAVGLIGALFEAAALFLLFATRQRVRVVDPRTAEVA